MRCPPLEGTVLRIPADEHPVMARELPCPRKPPSQDVGRPSGLACKLLPSAIHRFAHFLSRYCAEWLTSESRVHKGKYWPWTSTGFMLIDHS